ncbi:MAG: DUF4293 domain-containing protein [Sphingobacteriales bacterium]
MLQRIQSVYFLLAGLVIFALFLFPLVHNVTFAGVPSSIWVTGIFMERNLTPMQVQSFPLLTDGTILVGLLPLIPIFLFKNRKLQVGLGYVYMLLVIGYSYWQVQTIKSLADISVFKFSNFGIGIFIAPISIVLTLLAIKAVQRDEKLIKSADRLR